MKASNNKGVSTVDGFVLNDIFSKNIKKTIIYVDSSCWGLPKQDIPSKRELINITTNIYGIVGELSSITIFTVIEWNHANKNFYWINEKHELSLDVVEYMLYRNTTSKEYSMILKQRLDSFVSN